MGIWKPWSDDIRIFICVATRLTERKNGDSCLDTYITMIISTSVLSKQSPTQHHSSPHI